MPLLPLLSLLLFCCLLSVVVVFVNIVVVVLLLEAALILSRFAHETQNRTPKKHNHPGQAQES